MGQQTFKSESMEPSVCAGCDLAPCCSREYPECVETVNTLDPSEDFPKN